MVDRDGRATAAAEIEGRIVQEQKQHLAAFEKLEAGDGLDLDVLTDIFGLDVLDASKPYARELLEKFNKLYEELTNRSDLFCVAGIARHRLPGCTGLGQEAEYENVLSAAIIENPWSAEVVCVPGSGDSKPMIVLRGLGFVLSPSGELPNISEPEQVEFLLAGMMELHSSGLEVPGHNLDVIRTDDSGFEIYKALDDARGLGRRRANNVVGWTRDYWGQRSRQLHGA